jgi:hypothetical protein
MLSDDPPPELWQPACVEYFRDFAEGIYDSAGQHYLVLRRGEVELNFERGDLVVGSAGCDGIYFCFRKGQMGVWAYYPIEDRHVLVAPTLQRLAEGWFDGSISV